MKRYKILLVFLLCIANIHRVKAEKLVPNPKLGTRNMPFSIENILPLKYVKDGSFDYTNYIQQAINTYNNITFPGFPILINEKGLMLKANSRITFMPGSKLILKPTSKSNYSVLQLRNVSNVILINPVIIGDRDLHQGTEGEWGMGISIYSSSNITITGGNITNCWGDGIYISRTKNDYSSTMIHISNTSLNYNRRDGISVISVNGLLIDSVYSANCNGTLPMSGINFEPESSKDDLENIEIRNVRTENNPGNGIQIGFNKLYGGSNKNIDIKIINHTDKGSNIGFKISDNVSRRVGNETISGTVLVQEPDWESNALSPMQTSIYDKQLKLRIYSPVIEKTAGKKLKQGQIKDILKSKACINKEADCTLYFK